MSFHLILRALYLLGIIKLVCQYICIPMSYWLNKVEQNCLPQPSSRPSGPNILYQVKRQYKSGVIFTTSKFDTNIETLLLITVTAMILHLLKNVKVPRCLMVFY